MPFITAKDGAAALLVRVGRGRADPVPEQPRLQPAGCGTTSSPPSPSRAFAASASTAEATAAPISRRAAMSYDTFADDVAVLIDEARSLRPHPDRPFDGGRRDGALPHPAREKRIARARPPGADDADAALDHDNPNGVPRALRGAVGAVAPRLSQMGRRQCRAVLHSGDLARVDALGRGLAADLASGHARLQPRDGGGGLPRRDAAHRGSDAASSTATATARCRSKSPASPRPRSSGSPAPRLPGRAARPDVHPHERTPR